MQSLPVATEQLLSIFKELASCSLAQRRLFTVLAGSPNIHLFVPFTIPPSCFFYYFPSIFYTAYSWQQNLKEKCSRRLSSNLKTKQPETCLGHYKVSLSFTKRCSGYIHKYKNKRCHDIELNLRKIFVMHIILIYSVKHVMGKYKMSSLFSKLRYSDVQFVNQSFLWVNSFQWISSRCSLFLITQKLPVKTLWINRQRFTIQKESLDNQICIYIMRYWNLFIILGRKEYFSAHIFTNMPSFKPTNNKSF